MDSSNLVSQLNKQLPQELSSFLQLAGNIAGEMQIELYLVGGVVRDLLLGRPNQDLDLVVDGDSQALAKEIARQLRGKAVYHPRFMTATVRWEKWSVDLAAARRESYAAPGALPDVQPSDIQMDLIRRDFSVNAMAVYLAPLRYGRILDPFDGQIDLGKKLIRILHDDSFKDDPTRVWRAVRYEQRLAFDIEPHTLALLKENLGYLAAVSGDRLRHELELALREEKPERVLLRAEILGILGRFQPPLKPGLTLLKEFARLRSLIQPYAIPEELYLALLTYNFRPDELEQFVANLNFSKAVARVMQDSLALKAQLSELGRAEVSRSTIYNLLEPYSPTAILANLFSVRSSALKGRLELYLNELRQVQSQLAGEDLKELGIPAGPKMKNALKVLRDARLDGQVSSRQEEIALVKKWAGRPEPPAR
jgi:tRNA nucleotidyltransferase (CCA-adding enzyme)